MPGSRLRVIIQTMQASRDERGPFRINGRKSVYVKDPEQDDESANKRYVDSSLNTVVANIESGNNEIPWAAITGEPSWLQLNQGSVSISGFANDSGYITLVQIPDQGWAQITSKPAWLDDFSHDIAVPPKLDLNNTLAMNGNPIKEVGDPVNSLDAINRTWADNRYLQMASLPTQIASQGASIDVSGLNNDASYVTSITLDTRIPQSASDWLKDTSYYNGDNRDIVLLNANLDCGQVRITPITSWKSTYTGKIALVCGTSTWDGPANGRIVQCAPGIGALDVAVVQQLPTKTSDLTNDSGFVTSTAADWSTLTNVPQWLQDIVYYPTASTRPAIVFDGHRATFDSIQALPPLPESSVSITCGSSASDESLMGTIRYVKPATGDYEVTVLKQVQEMIADASLNNESTAVLPDNISCTTLTASTSVGSALGDFTYMDAYTMNGNIAMATNKITGLGDPTAAQDAVTLAYGDANYAAIDINNRLVLYDTAGTSSLASFSASNVGPFIAPAEATNFGVIAHNSITPVNDDVYNIGQYGLRYRNIYTRRFNCDVMGYYSNNFEIGQIDLTTGGNNTDWFIGQHIIPATSDVGGRVGLVRHGWHVCGGCLSCEVSVFWL